MGSISSITVYDGADPPVQHSLTPVSVTRKGDEITAFWREDASDVPLDAQVRCTMSLKRQGSGVYRVESRVEVPVQEVVTGSNAAGYSAAPKVAFVDTVVTTGLFHPRSTTAGRRLVRQLAVNIDGSVASSVTPAVTGPLPQLFDLLIAPT